MDVITAERSTGCFALAMKTHVYEGGFTTERLTLSSQEIYQVVHGCRELGRRMCCLMHIANRDEAGRVASSANMTLGCLNELRNCE